MRHSIFLMNHLLYITKLYYPYILHVTIDFRYAKRNIYNYLARKQEKRYLFVGNIKEKLYLCNRKSAITVL